MGHSPHLSSFIGSDHKAPPSTKLFVGQLTSETTEQDVQVPGVAPMVVDARNVPGQMEMGAG